MSENLPNIDDLFRKALEEHEDSPSASVWANIDKNLDKKKVVFISEKYRKLKWAAAALLIFSAGLAMYTVHTRMRNKELVKQNEINKGKTLDTKGLKQGNVGMNITKPGEAAKADTLLVDSTSKQSIAGKTENAQPATTSAKKGTMALNEVAVKATFPDGKQQGVKVWQEKIVEDVAVNNNTGFNSRQKAALKSVQRSIETKPADKQTIPMASSEKTSKPSPKATERINQLNDELTEEKLLRNVDLATARATENNMAMAPVEIVPGSKSAIAISGSRETITNAAKSNFRKPPIKPFKESRLSATFFYSPDLVTSQVNDDHHNFREDDRNEIKNKERISNASSKGVMVSYNIGRGWNLQTGVAFSSMTTYIEPKTIFARPDDRGNIHYRFNCSAGYSFVTVKSANSPAAGDSIVALSSKNILQYFSIPFGLAYNLPVGRRFTLQPTAGLTMNFLTKGSLETEIAAQGGNEKSSLDHIEGLNQSYLNSSVSVAATYYFTKHIGLSFTPVARLGLSGINKGAAVKTYLNSIGLAAGITIGF